jgi:hypothetical protein
VKLPELGEGWSWNITRPVVRCTNAKCCAEDSEGHPKVRIELLLHDKVRRYGTIDVGMYGEGRAVIERTQAMVNDVRDDQLRAVGL